jgi:hypothetical protein
MTELQQAFLDWSNELIPDNSSERAPSHPDAQTEYYRIRNKLIENIQGPIRRFKPRDYHKRLILWCRYVDLRDNLEPWTTFKITWIQSLDTIGERESVKPFVPNHIFNQLQREHPPAIFLKREPAYGREQ